MCGILYGLLLRNLVNGKVKVRRMKIEQESGRIVGGSAFGAFDVLLL